MNKRVYFAIYEIILIDIRYLKKSFRVQTLYYIWMTIADRDHIPNSEVSCNLFRSPNWNMIWSSFIFKWSNMFKLAHFIDHNWFIVIEFVNWFPRFFDEKLRFLIEAISNHFHRKIAVRVGKLKFESTGYNTVMGIITSHGKSDIEVAFKQGFYLETLICTVFDLRSTKKHFCKDLMHKKYDENFFVPPLHFL